MRKQIWGSKFSKREPQCSKNEDTPILGMFWCIRATKSVPLNFAIAVKLYFVHLLLIKMVGMLKSRGIAWNQVFCVKNVDFSPNHKVFLGKNVPIMKN